MPTRAVGGDCGAGVAAGVRDARSDSQLQCFGHEHHGAAILERQRGRQVVQLAEQAIVLGPKGDQRSHSLAQRRSPPSVAADRQRLFIPPERRGTRCNYGPGEGGDGGVQVQQRLIVAAKAMGIDRIMIAGKRGVGKRHEYSDWQEHVGDNLEAGPPLVSHISCRKSWASIPGENQWL